MCGIAGVVSATDAGDRGALAVSLGRALAHRGPDAEGVYTSPRALLVHRRLAIIDPSPSGAQPMGYDPSPSGAGRYQLVYNGEIYNYRALRADLESRGERFATASDTEVLLRLLVRDGPRALARARGMFALALWDEVGGLLTLARDRFGIKPLYVAEDRRRIAFASEIGALLGSGLASRTPSPAGVLAYLSWASIPAPLTWLRDVEALAPGTWRSWAADGTRQEGRFADVATAYATGVPAPGETALREVAGEAVRDSVRAHLTADVPVGLFLSGGIDSGAIASAARSVAGGDLHTYTVIVDDAGHSEGPLAARVAAEFETTHHELRVDAAHIARDWPAILARLDQPTADAVNTYYVSRAVAQTGVKAVLSGLGGDELFGGYPSFERLPAGLQIARVLGPAMRATGAAAAVALPAWRAAKWQHFAQEPDLAQAYRALRGFLMPAELTAIAGPALGDTRADAEAQLAAVEERLFAPAGPEVPIASVARLETCGFLRSQLLRDVDAVSMAHGLEVRVPFVDHVLQAAVWPALGSHPPLLQGKRLLHETLERPLPHAVTARPKQGFTLPMDAWMRTALRETTREGLQLLADSGWIAAEAPDRILGAWERGQAHWSRPWGLGVLGWFLQEAR